jgi:phage gpG-like protein
MADIAWGVGLIGAAQTMFAVTTLSAVLTDLSPFWPVIRKQLQDAEWQMFAFEGAPGPGGEPWRELSKTYGAWKAAKYPGKPILQLTGRLVDSLTGDTDDSIYETYPEFMIYGTEAGMENGISYAVYHQEGTDLMPARPIFDDDVLADALEPAVFKAATMIEDMWRGKPSESEMGGD